MSRHLRTVFSGRMDSPHMGFRMWNRAATQADPGDVVCFYPHFTITDQMWFRGLTATHSILGNGDATDQARYRVAGVAMQTIANNASGIIVFGGLISGVYVTGPVEANDRLILSSIAKTAVGSIVSADRGKGWSFGFSLETNAGNRRLIKAMLVPWRI